MGVSGADLDVLALVAAAPDFHKSSRRPSIRPTSWRSARNRRARTAREAVEVAGGVVLGTVPAGTTEAQGDDMNSVVEVAGEHSRGETDAADFAQDERRRIIEEARDLDEWEPANSDYNSDDDANTRIKKNL